MPLELANAYPRKQFFLEMFTRDISLEDCILDMIDNSIDALIRTRQLDISQGILKHDAPQRVSRGNHLPSIDVSYTSHQFQITDKCGGIDHDYAREEVFCFGHSSGGSKGQLGAYGIGLKRAIFKIGNRFDIASQTTKNGFQAKLNVAEWSKKDETIEDWKIPTTPLSGVKSIQQAGTSITIKELRPEVQMRLSDGSLDGSLRVAIAQTYSLFLERYAHVTLNGKLIEPFPIPLGQSDDIEPGSEEFSDGVVKVRLIASLASRGPKGEWRYDRAGWYVFCNGRAVLAADKSEITGWGVGLPLYHSKYNGFVGLAFFSSTKPLLLPWTTTKRGLNRESRVYQKARDRMMGLARPIITFLNQMYPSELSGNPEERDIAEKLKVADIRNVAQGKGGQFKVVNKRQYGPKTTVRITYEAEIDDVERIKKHLKQPSWGANKVGKHTFDYFLSQECPQ